MTAPKSPMPDLVDLVVEDPRWAEHDFSGLAEKVCVATLSHLNLLGGNHEIAVLACDDARIKNLNSDFRAKPQATNVLSWPSVDLAPETEGMMPELPENAAELGDIAIAYETCKSEATAQNKVFTDHISHLLAHGTLHLLGYDHVREKDAVLMEGLEVQILAKLGIADPY